jgi:hypothetical protein
MNLVAKALVELGIELDAYVKNTMDDALYQEYEAKVAYAEIKNPWFIKKFVIQSLEIWSQSLSSQNIENWLASTPKASEHKTIAVIGAGNLPLVAFHDCISVLISGHTLWLKCSSDDEVLLPFILERLTTKCPGLDNKIELKTQGLQKADALIATGSDNSARYFEYYFRHMPTLLRKNRTSVAILDETTTDEELKMLASDMFVYFGRGCRSVSKLFVHENFDIQRIFENSVDYSYFKDHNKYVNNFDYHRAIYLMNVDKFLENDFFVLKESDGMHAPVSVYFYERFSKIEHVIEKLADHKDQLQVVSGNGFENTIGSNQCPTLCDYADGVDVLAFLAKV